MSWETFKNNVKRKLDNPNSTSGVEEIAKIFATEYDAAVKRGGDLVNKIKVRNGQKDLMETFVTLALFRGITSQSGFNILNELGKGVKVYWTGAILQNTPIPLIPATGAVANQSITSAIVTNPGTWLELPQPIPTDKTETFVNLFILAARIHLTTVSGVINTISLYPPTSTPSPGVVPWTGYFITPPSIQRPNVNIGLENKFGISFDSPAGACGNQNTVEINGIAIQASLSQLSAFEVVSDTSTFKQTNFYLSDGKGYREFKWVEFPRIAVPVSNIVQSCGIS